MINLDLKRGTIMDQHKEIEELKKQLAAGAEPSKEMALLRRIKLLEKQAKQPAAPSAKKPRP
jgi:hypothetical protein